jgi:hypothetical protein
MANIKKFDLQAGEMDFGFFPLKNLGIFKTEKFDCLCCMEMKVKNGVGDGRGIAVHQNGQVSIGNFKSNGCNGFCRVIEIDGA